jgi:hypothetical protein
MTTIRRQVDDSPLLTPGRHPAPDTPRRARGNTDNHNEGTQP